MAIPLSLSVFEQRVIDLRQENYRISHGGEPMPAQPTRIFASGDLCLQDHVRIASLGYEALSRIGEDKNDSQISEPGILRLPPKTRYSDLLPDNQNLRLRRKLPHISRSSLEKQPYFTNDQQGREVVLGGLRLLSEARATAVAVRDNEERARIHYQANKQAYIALALAEAFLRGVDINLSTTPDAPEV